MSDKLGPGSYNSTQLAINTMILEMNDIEFQRLMNSESEQYTHKQSSIELENVQDSYNTEIKLVRNEMRAVEDKTSNEYFDLMSELEELEDERDAEVKRLENEASDKEKKYQVQDTNLETRYNAVKADKEGIEEAQKSNIQRS